MKNKFIIIFFILFISSFFVIAINSQEGDLNNGLIDSQGFNSETGLPKEFGQFKNISDKLSQEEERKEYLEQEWTKLLANNKVFGPILFYTNKIFSFFNPLWKLTFQINFSWSWAFILSLVLFITLMIFIYSPLKSFTEFNPILNLIISFLVVVLIGISRAIKQVIDLLIYLLSDIWKLLLFIVIAFFIVFFYKKIIKSYGDKLKKEADDEKTEKNKKIIDAYAESSKDALGLP